MWEVAIKLAGSVVAARMDTDAPSTERKLARLVHQFARPSLGQWLELSVLLTKAHAAADLGSAKFLHFLHSQLREHPKLRQLDRVLAETIARPQGTTVFTLFEKIVAWRNVEIGHGAAGLREDALYDRLSYAFLEAAYEMFGRFDLLSGHGLIYLASIEETPAGFALEQYLLSGERPVRSETQCWLTQTQRVAEHTVYLVKRGEEHFPERWHSLSPLWTLDLDAAKPYIFNGVHRNQLRYLCYTSGDNISHGQVSDLSDFLRRFETDRSKQAILDDLLAVDDVDSEYDDLRARFKDENQLGEYCLLSVLGRGGMGIVYRALQPSLNRQVAVKRLSFLGNEEAKRRFRREIETLGKAEHPNLVKIYSSGAEDDVFFYSMELVEGSDLGGVFHELAKTPTNAANQETWHAAITTAIDQNREQETPINDEANRYLLEHSRQATSRAFARGTTKKGLVFELATLMSQVSRAAHTLHELGVVHRDIKPDNIMISMDGSRAVLMDLGIAKRLDDSDGPLTRTTQFIGTLRYASPEQVRCSSDVDRRSDVYSIGATFWELLTLRRIHGTTAETPDRDLWARAKEGVLEGPHRFNPRVPRDLSAIVSKCLATEPTRRYQTARELADDLDRFLHAEPVHAQPPSLAYHAKKFAARNIPAIAIALVVVIALLTLVAGYVASIRRDGIRARQSLAEKNQILAKSDLQLAASQLDEGRTILGVYSLVEARELWNPDASDTGLVDRIINYRMARLPALVPTPERPRIIRFSGDSERMVAVSPAPTSVRFWNARTGQPLSDPHFLPENTDGDINTVALNRQGTLLAIASEDLSLATRDDNTNTVSIYRTTDWTAVASTSIPVRIEMLLFTHDDDRLNLFLEEGSVYQWSLEDGKSPIPLVQGRKMSTSPNEPPAHFFADPTRKLFCVHSENSLNLFRANDGQQVGQTLTVNEFVSGVLGNKTTVAITTKNTCRLWNPMTNQVEDLSDQPDKYVVFAPNGNRYWIWDSTLQTDALPTTRWYRHSSSIYPEIHQAIMTEPEDSFDRREDVIVFSPDRTRCIVDNAIYDITPGVGIPIPLQEPNGDDVVDAGIGGTQPRQIRFSQEGTFLSLESEGYSRPFSYTHWDIANGTLLDPNRMEETFGARFEINTDELSFGPSSSQLLRFVPTNKKIQRVEATENDRYIAMTGETADGKAAFVLKNADGKTVLTRISPHPMEFAINPTGTTLAIWQRDFANAIGGDCHLWRLDTLTEQNLGNKITDVALSRDGSRVAILNNHGTVTISEFHGDQHKEFQLDLASNVSCISISHRSDILITGSHSGTLLLWDLKSRLQLTGPYFSDGRIRFAAMDPTERFLVAFASEYLRGELWTLPKLNIQGIDQLKQLAERRTKNRLEDKIPMPISFDQWKQTFAVTTQKPTPD